MSSLKAPVLVLKGRAVQDSPLAGLMHLAQREAAADVVNAAILVCGSSKPEEGKREDKKPVLPSTPKPQVLFAARSSFPPKPCFHIHRLIQVKSLLLSFPPLI